MSIAEGEGLNGVHLAKKGLSVTGVEFAPSAVAKANKLATLNKVDVAFVQSDLFEWSWPYNGFVRLRKPHVNLTIPHLATNAGNALFVFERTTWIGQDPITFVQAVTAPGYQLSALN